MRLLPVPKNREFLAEPELAYTVWKKRSPHRLLDVYEDVWIEYQRSWKQHRGKQWKKIGLINWHVHAPGPAYNLQFWSSYFKPLLQYYGEAN